MDDKKNYLEKLGFNPDDEPSQEEIEKQYEKCISEHMLYARQGKNDEQADRRMEEITKAYNELTGRKKVDFDNKWFQGFNVTTLKNFVYLFKLQIAAVVFILICAGITIYEVANRVEFDFQVMTAGDMMYDYELFDKRVKAVVPEVKEISFKTLESLGYEGFLAMYVAGDLDALFVDSEYYEQLAKQGYFMSLDDMAKKYKLNLKDQQDYIVKDEDDEEAHLYGIQVSDCPLIKDALISDDIVIGVLRRRELNEKAIIYVENLMQELKNLE